MTTTEAAWLAGFIDGEGCFHAAVRKEGRMALQVHIANTNRPVMEEVARLLGVDNLRSTKLRRGWRTRWSVTLCGATKILALLDEVEPYLVCKKEEAATFRALAETYPGAPSKYRIPDEVSTKRRVLWAQLREARQKEYA